MNVYLEGSGRIMRVSQSGTGHASSTGKMLVADGPYWSESDIKISRNQVMWFRIWIPEPGQYPIVVLLDSPEFYDPEDQRYDSYVLNATRSGNEVATQPTAPRGNQPPLDSENDA